MWLDQLIRFSNCIQVIMYMDNSVPVSMDASVSDTTTGKSDGCTCGEPFREKTFIEGLSK